MQSLALSKLPKEFAKIDKRRGGTGIVGPIDAIYLIIKLAKPGLDFDDFYAMLCKKLSLHLPRLEVYKYFTTMDVDGSGVIEAAEFVPLFRFILIDVYPRRALESMNLSTRQIVGFVSFIVTLMGLFFGLVLIVMNAFSVKGKGAATVHSTVNSVIAGAMKMFSDQGVGFEGSMSQLLARLEPQAIQVLGTVLALPKGTFDIFINLMTSTKPT